MSKANPSVPATLDNPELARDMRTLAIRLDEQVYRYNVENGQRPLAALFTVGLSFNQIARDLRRAADHVQPEEDPLPTVATMQADGRVLTLRARPDGTVTAEDVAAFQRECNEAVEASRKGSGGRLSILPPKP